MKLISIYINGVEIDYIQETLSLKTDLSLFPDSLKFVSNEFPFLIIDNDRTDELFGLNNISVDSNAYYNVTIVTLEGSVPGELQLLECLPGHRKCNIRFSSKLFAESKKKIRDLMPIVSVTNTEPPIPFTEKYEGIPPAPSSYATYVDLHRFGNFPNTLWKAAKISFPTKKGDYLKLDDKWYHYNRYLNGRNPQGEYILNNLEDTPEGGVVHNLNIPTWNIYLLTPLWIICENIGLQFPTQLLNDEFVSSIAFYSPESNLTEVTVGNDLIHINIPQYNWSEIIVTNDPDKHIYKWSKTFPLFIEKAGKHVISYKFKGLNNAYRLNYRTQESDGALDVKNKVIEDVRFFDLEHVFDNQFEFEVTQEEVDRGLKFFIEIFANKPEDPFEVDHFYSNDVLHKSGFMFHPTIEFGRYLPNWTVGEYLDQLRLLLNIQFSETENNTVLNVEYNDTEVSIIDYVDLGSLYIADYQKNEITDVVIKYGNDIDPKVIVDKHGTHVTKSTIEEKTKLLENKFKFIPSVLLESTEDKDGEGLILLTPGSDSPTSQVDNKNLTIESIYSNYYQDSCEVFLASNRLIIEKSITSFVLNEIIEKRKVLLNKRPYLVEDITRESTSDLIDVKLHLTPL